MLSEANESTVTFDTAVRAVTDALFELIYQLEAEGELGDGPHSDAWRTARTQCDQLEAALRSLVGDDEAAELVRTAAVAATRRVHGE